MGYLNTMRSHVHGSHVHDKAAPRRVLVDLRTSGLTARLTDWISSRGPQFDDRNTREQPVAHTQTEGGQVLGQVAVFISKGGSQNKKPVVFLAASGLSCVQDDGSRTQNKGCLRGHE